MRRLGIGAAQAWLAPKASDLSLSRRFNGGQLSGLLSALSNLGADTTKPNKAASGKIHAGTVRTAPHQPPTSPSQHASVSRDQTATINAASGILECPECSKVFTSPAVLQHHRLSRHNISAPPASQAAASPASARDAIPSPSTTAAAASADTSASLTLGEQIEVSTARVELARAEINQLKRKASDNIPSSTSTLDKAIEKAAPSSAPSSAPSLAEVGDPHQRVQPSTPTEKTRPSEQKRELSGDEGLPSPMVPRQVGEGVIISRSSLDRIRSSPHRRGTSSSCEIIGKATHVAFGTIANGTTPILQFRLTTTSYRPHFDNVRLFKNTVLVRLRGDHLVAAKAIPEGSTVLVRGLYAKHSSFDPTTRTNVENTVVDVGGTFGYCGMLFKQTSLS